MPTTITAQNGAQIKKTTAIQTLGCKAKVRLSRAQLLTKALRACRKRYRHNRHRRLACERQARRRYGARSTRHGSHHQAGARRR